MMDVLFGGRFSLLASRRILKVRSFASHRIAVLTKSDLIALVISWTSAPLQATDVFECLPGTVALCQSTVYMCACAIPALVHSTI